MDEIYMNTSEILKEIVVLMMESYSIDFGYIRIRQNQGT